MWKSQFYRLRQFYSGMLSSIFVLLCRNFTIRFSLSKSKRVHSYRTVPQAITILAFYLPYLNMESPALLTTPIFSSHPPKKEAFLTLPVICAPLMICSLSPILPLLQGFIFLPISCSLSIISLAKMRQQWSRQCSFIFLQLTAKQTSSYLQLSLSLRQPLWVAVKSSFILLVSQRGKDRSYRSREFYRIQRYCSIHMFRPFFEGVQTQQRSRRNFLSAFQGRSRADGGQLLGSFAVLLAYKGEKLKFTRLSSLQQLTLGEFTALFSGIILILIGVGRTATTGRTGCTGTDSFSSDELLPNCSFLLLMSSCRQASLSALYLSLSPLKSVSIQFEVLEESVLNASVLSFYLRATGCFQRYSCSDSEEEDLP